MPRSTKKRTIIGFYGLPVRCSTESFSYYAKNNKTVLANDEPEKFVRIKIDLQERIRRPSSEKMADLNIISI